jgi:hypothetical protein
MTKQSLDPTAPKISVDGLEHVFVEVIDSHVIEGTPGTHQGIPEPPLREPPEGIPVEAAAKRLGTSTRAIIKRLQKGTLKGYKVPGKFGDKWTVAFEGVPNNSQDIPQESPAGTPVQTQGVPVEIVQELLRKVEALTYRNGYLEGQLVEKEEQIQSIKLLTDSLLSNSQHKTKWWQRFIPWVTGR